MPKKPTLKEADSLFKKQQYSSAYERYLALLNSKNTSTAQASHNEFANRAYLKKQISLCNHKVAKEADGYLLKIKKLLVSKYYLRNLLDDYLERARIDRKPRTINEVQVIRELLSDRYEELADTFHDHAKTCEKRERLHAFEQAAHYYQKSANLVRPTTKRLFDLHTSIIHCYHSAMTHALNLNDKQYYAQRIAELSTIINLNDDIDSFLCALTFFEAFQLLGDLNTARKYANQSIGFYLFEHYCKEELDDEVYRMISNLKNFLDSNEDINLSPLIEETQVIADESPLLAKDFLNLGMAERLEQIIIKTKISMANEVAHAKNIPIEEMEEIISKARNEAEDEIAQVKATHMRKFINNEGTLPNSCFVYGVDGSIFNKNYMLSHKLFGRKIYPYQTLEKLIETFESTDQVDPRFRTAVMIQKTVEELTQIYNKAQTQYAIIKENGNLTTKYYPASFVKRDLLMSEFDNDKFRPKPRVMSQPQESKHLLAISGFFGFPVENQDLHEAIAKKLPNSSTTSNPKNLPIIVSAALMSELMSADMVKEYVNSVIKFFKENERLASESDSDNDMPGIPSRRA